MNLQVEAASRVSAAKLNSLLACPDCHLGLEPESNQLHCKGCGYRGELSHGVVASSAATQSGTFDEKFEVMQESNDQTGTKKLFYTRQAEFLKSYLQPGKVVLDIGCGPAVHYENQENCFLIGLDPSYSSVRVNKSLNMKICGSAEALPLRSGSVDTILCLYSIHHMVGENTAESRKRVEQGLQEFKRVIAPGGEILIFEVCPWAPAWHGERLIWNTARKVLGKKLDMHFWSKPALEKMGAHAFPGAQFDVVSFESSPWTTFPPAFTLPWLKIPRGLYPFNVNCLRWKMP